jgi:hypothetical protein
MAIMSVKEFNKMGYEKYKKAIGKYEFGKGGFPALSMYQFINEKTGKPKKTGYVGTFPTGAFYSETKKGVIEKLRGYWKLKKVI